jgi:hypothetical protein
MTKQQSMVSNAPTDEDEKAGKLMGRAFEKENVV